MDPYEQGYAAGLAAGTEAGYRRGYERGYGKGYEKGREEGPGRDPDRGFTVAPPPDLEGPPVEGPASIPETRIIVTVPRGRDPLETLATEFARRSDPTRGRTAWRIIAASGASMTVWAPVDAAGAQALAAFVSRHSTPGEASMWAVECV